jgi:CubicO group peptidase (beta-lactamase class C family)
MTPISRRRLGGLTLALAAQAGRLGATTPGIEETLRQGVTRRRIPAVAAMVATEGRTIWSGGFGSRDSASGVSVGPDSIFAIASMTKAITSTAVMQLLEKGKVKLNEPAGKYLSALEKLDVLEGFNREGNPILRPATKPVTLHNLLTHTSGFAYDMWDQNMLRYNSRPGVPSPRVAAEVTPLIFEPGTRWQYGTGVDWVGRIVEAVSGLTLEDYFQRNILQPLGMQDTSFACKAEKFGHLVSTYRRQADGSLKEDPRKLPPAPGSFNGGGGLFSTCTDYVKFMQMILRRGEGPHGARILEAATVGMMSSNQIGDLGAGRLKTARPNITEDVDLHAGFTDKWTYGFLTNPAPYPGGRSAGSLAWAGIENTFYWIDPKRSLCAVVMMQFYPFVDREAVGLLSDFEKAVYSAGV